jgi:nitric oxide reductase NorE protein
MSESLATRSSTGADVPARPSGRRIPGEGGIWVFIVGDMVMFGAFFGCFVHDRSRHLEVFAWSQAQMKIGFGAVNTCLLLTGSLFVVWAVQAVRREALDTARRFLALAFTCAAVFGIDKVIEWSEKIAHGLTPATNLYFMYFYMFTGLHAVHVIIGMIVLAHLRRLCGRPATGVDQLSSAQQRTIEVGASYWHLVDLLWVVLFALLYLMA